MFHFFLQSSGSSTLSLFTLLLMFIVIYFFFIRPQQKKQKDQDSFVSDLKKGDKIVMTSGIIGQISKIAEAEIQIQLDQKSFIRVLPSAISKELTEQFYISQE